MKDRILEICICNIEDAIQAQHAGADRLELCEDLSEGGITPQLGWVKEARQQLAIPIHILIRPRTGNFIYDRLEKNQMLREIDLFLAEGIDGIVIGALKSNHEIDIVFMKNCIQLIGSKHSTFHKAIDNFDKPSTQVKLISELGFDHILSSGGKANVIDGIVELNSMFENAENRTKIMPGGGLRSHNIGEILEKLNPVLLHSAARSKDGFFNKNEVTAMSQKLNSHTFTKN